MYPCPTVDTTNAPYNSPGIVGISFTYCASPESNKSTNGCMCKMNSNFINLLIKKRQIIGSKHSYQIINNEDNS